MRMMDELKPLFLYAANKKVYAPIDEKDKRKNSAILLLTNDLNTSSKLMMLSYVYNPNLFTSFYIDRNVMAYIDNIGFENVENFDEVEEESVSESMIYSKGWTADVEFVFDDNTSMIDQNYIKEAYNKDTVKNFARMLKLNNLPKKIKVIVYPNLGSLQQDAPKDIANKRKDKLFSYSFDNEIHIISKLVYDQETMDGPYDIYLITELIYLLLMHTNKDLPYISARAIASAVSSQSEWINNEDNGYCMKKTEEDKLAWTIRGMIKGNKMSAVLRYIRTNDAKSFSASAADVFVKNISKLLFSESQLSYFDRQRLLPSEFGIPNKRAYPMPDEDHVRAAIRMFNNCDPDDEKELAASIIKKMKKFGIDDVKVSAANKFRKYYNPEKKSKNESAFVESAIYNNDAFINLNTFEADTLYANNPHSEFPELNGFEFDPEDHYGEIFFTKDSHELIGYYITKFINNDIYITDLYINPKYNGHEIGSQLIERAMDRQNACGISIDPEDNFGLDYVRKKGFHILGMAPDNSYLMRQVNESSMINTDYENILKICSHLDPDEFKRISFYNVYRDSPFVIKRIIHMEGLEPAGFLDVYQFPSKPEIAQITIAVDNRFRGRGIADKMVSKLMNTDMNNFNFDMYYWTAHQDNYASQNLALKHGFEDTGLIDKYGRKVFVKFLNKYENKEKFSWNDIPSDIKPSYGKEFVATESSFITDDMALFTEADDPKYTQKLRRYLYKERLKNNKSVLELYDKVKTTNPEIRRMYIKISMYKKQNIFVDLSYYHSLFLKNNVYKLDKAVNFYFDFINRLINNKDIDDEYSKKTIFIPVDNGAWPVQPNTDITDFRKNLNPISIIVRLIRTNPELLKKAWGNKNIIFTGSRGYFTIDFNTFELRNISRFKTNIRKLMSIDEPIVDEYEVDNLEDDAKQPDTISKNNSDSSKAMAAKMIDRIENGTSIKINDISSIKKPPKLPSIELANHIHLRISNDPVEINKDIATESNGIAIITIDPDSIDGIKRNDDMLKGISKIDLYCLKK